MSFGVAAKQVSPKVFALEAIACKPSLRSMRPECLSARAFISRPILSGESGS